VKKYIFIVLAVMSLMTSCGYDSNDADAEGEPEIYFVHALEYDSVRAFEEGIRERSADTEIMKNNNVFSSRKYYYPNKGIRGAELRNIVVTKEEIGIHFTVSNDIMRSKSNEKNVGDNYEDFVLQADREHSLRASYLVTQTENPQERISFRIERLWDKKFQEIRHNDVQYYFTEIWSSDGTLIKYDFMYILDNQHVAYISMPAMMKFEELLAYVELTRHQVK